MKSLLLLLAAAMPTFGQMTGQPQAILTHGAGDTVNLDWEGLAARSYFLQYSEDLQTWNYFPVVELGADDTISYGFSSTADKFFVRLQYTDDPTDDPENADFDGDGLTNLEEISIYHTNPFNPDTDGDGLTDGYEIQNGLDPKDDGSVDFNNGAYGDPDGDGISNLEEQKAGTNPQSATDFPPNIIEEIRLGAAHLETFSGGTSGEFSAYRYWDSIQVSTANDTTPLTPSSVLSRLDSTFTFEATPANLATATHLVLPTAYMPAGHAGFNVWSSGSNTAKAASLLQTRIWVNAPASPTARTYTFLKRERYTSAPATMQLGSTSTPTETLGTTTIETLTIPANGTISNFLDLAPAGQQDPGSEKWTYTTASQVSIVPDDGMAGVVGDMIPSNKTVNPELHFVSPKKTTEIPNDYVVLKAVGLNADEITDGDPRQIVEWNGGEEVSGEPLKRRVKRDVENRYVVSIKVKSTGQSIYKINIWIVWCSVTANSGVGVFGIEPNYSIFYTSPNSSDIWKFSFLVNPAPIYIVSGDIPNLSGMSSKSVPGSDFPAYNDDNFKSQSPEGRDSAKFKWDISRKLQIKVFNPNLISRTALTATAGTDWLYANQPLASVNAVNFPALDVEGNDDSLSVLDEHDDPYHSFSGPPSFSHALGEIVSNDSPQIPIIKSAGANGNQFSVVYNFKEFARLEIWDGRRTTGTFWFRVSDFKEWHHALRTKFDGSSNQWIDNPEKRSSSGLGNVND